MNIPFDTVFNDEYLIIVNKIAKILIQPSGRDKEPVLSDLIEKEIGQKVFPCHRLDRETSGLIIYAKSKNVQDNIMDQFRARKVEKKYIAFVKGRVKKKKGLLKGYIIDREGEIFGEKKKEAKTVYETIKEFNEWSVVELKPLTGRTNQLRIQLANIGHPILGESKYAFRRDFKVKFKRLALHAFYLSFIHPLSGEKTRVSIDLALDMSEFLKKGVGK
jgi:RluA family pseudouridine synthase